MVSFTEAVGNAVRSLRCQVLGANAFVNGAIGLVAPGLVAAYDDQIARSRRLLGCDPANDPTPPDPPFDGGQCPTNYTATAFRNGIQQNIGGRSPRTVTGPLGGVSSEDILLGTPFPDTTIRVWSFSNNPDQNFVAATFRASDPGTLSFTISRADGNPDDCGDPDPVYPPPTTINFNTDVTYNIDDGTEVTVNIPFTFSPIEINFDGSLRVPFTFDFGGFAFNGSFSLNPSLRVVINPPALPVGSGQGTDDLEPGDPEDEVPPRPPAEKIVGVVVTSTLQQTSGLTTIDAQNMPDTIAPRAGSIKFAYSLGLATFWSNDIDIKGDRVFIPCPFSQGADAAVASPVPGVSLSFVEIKGFPLATTGDL